MQSEFANLEQNINQFQQAANVLDDKARQVSVHTMLV